MVEKSTKLNWHICKISLRIDERHAKDINRTKTQMITLNEPFNLDELLETIKEHQFTRLSITDDGNDHIKGFINVKEF